MKIIDIFNNKKFMGINFRNQELIHKLNNPESINLVDDKILFKEKLIKNNIPTPKLISVISSLKNFEKIKELNPPFVIKPSRGYAGGGIIVLEKINNEYYEDISGTLYDTEDLRRHFLKIFDGFYSLSNDFDQVLIEEKIEMPKNIKKIFPIGIPDIRIIYYHYVPVIAMVRVPTVKSGGRANLSQGADALHVDVKTGKVLNYYDSKNKRHILPLPRKYDFTLPHWDKILEIGEQSSKLSQLGYSGVDIVYDKKGPMILECNARSGIEIQNVTKQNIFNLIENINIPKESAIS